MVICLMRIFKSWGSVMLTVRRHRQTNCIIYKTFSYMIPSTKEIINYEYLPSVVHGYNSKITLDSSPQFRCTNSMINEIAHMKKNIVFNNSNNRQLEASKLGSLMYSATECKVYKEVQKDSGNPGRPEPNQVLHVFDVLSEDLPKLFHKPLNYKIYHPDIIFENNIRGTKTVGIFPYSKQIAMLKTIMHIKFVQVQFEILKITAHPEDGTVRVRWRIKGVPCLKALLSIWKYMSSNKYDASEGWYDGFSIFYVRSDGLVHKHTVDKMIPDSEDKVSHMQNNLAVKMALALGIAVKEFSPYTLSANFQQKREIGCEVWNNNQFQEFGKQPILNLEYCTIKIANSIYL